MPLETNDQPRSIIRDAYLECSNKSKKDAIRQMINRVRVSKAGFGRNAKSLKKSHYS